MIDNDNHMPLVGIIIFALFITTLIILNI